MSRKQLAGLSTSIAAAIVLAAAAAVAAQATPSHPLAPPEPIVKYQLTYSHAGTLIQVTTQDAKHHITQFPCSPPAAAAASGNYSVSCDRALAF